MFVLPVRCDAGSSQLHCAADAPIRTGVARAMAPFFTGNADEFRCLGFWFSQQANKPPYPNRRREIFYPVNADNAVGNRAKPDEFRVVYHMNLRAKGRTSSRALKLLRNP